MQRNVKVGQLVPFPDMLTVLRQLWLHAYRHLLRGADVHSAAVHPVQGAPWGLQAGCMHVRNL